MIYRAVMKSSHRPSVFRVHNQKDLINFQSHLRNPTTQMTISEPTKNHTYPQPIPLSETNDVTPKVEFQGQETHSKYKRYSAVAQFFKNFSR